MHSVVPMQVADSPRASRTSEFAELKRQLDAADTNIVLVNKRLDESQSMRLFFLFLEIVKGLKCLYDMLWLQAGLLPWKP